MMTVLAQVSGQMRGGRGWQRRTSGSRPSPRPPRPCCARRPTTWSVPNTWPPRPGWPDSPWGRVAAAAWHGRCDVFTDFLRPALRACAESVTHLAGANVTESAARLSDIAFRTCLADREGPVDLLARGLAALWFERDLTRVAGAWPRDLESAETPLPAAARRRTHPRAHANPSAVPR